MASEPKHEQAQAHQAAQPPPPAPPPRDEKAEAELRQSRREASYGAQVILDYEGDAALGARGGAAGTVEENTMIRDADLVRLGHVPSEPDNSLLGSPPNFVPGKGPEPKHRAPKLEAAERAAVEDRAQARNAQSSRK